MIARGIASQSGFHFINVQTSFLMNKWYGESQKYTAAIFSLARKLQPAVVFIDEVDSFLRNRDSSDHEATAMIKVSQLLMCSEHFFSKHGIFSILYTAEYDLLLGYELKDARYFSRPIFW